MLFPPAALERAMTIREVVIACRDHGVTLQCRYEVSNSVVQIEFVRLGLANSILPYFAVADHVIKPARLVLLEMSATKLWNY
jgi:DNA-binding transcriptional LysR family regulator